MPKIFLSPRKLVLGFLLISLGGSSLALHQRSGVAQSACPDLFAQAIEKARAAYTLSLKAETLPEWNNVALGWMEAITKLQSLPLEHPKNAFAQKKVTEYMDNLVIALRRVRSFNNPVPFTSFNNALLDEQMRLYLSYIEAVGVPDVLIVGSSRSLQAINPKEIRFALAGRGLNNLRVFNFSINGSTAKVVNFQLTQLLSQPQLPRMIIWADSAAAFNSGRVDRTWQNLSNSNGYRRVVAGDLPVLPPDPSCPAQGKQNNRNPNPQIPTTPFGLIPLNIDAYGFNYVEGVFDPNTYFQQVPLVPGRFDADYQNFSLVGEQMQAFNGVLDLARQQGISLVVVSLPLSSTYLDPVRSRYEQQWRNFMQLQANQRGFTFIDLANFLANRNEFFVDPSHLNYQGAAVVSRQLTVDNRIPWDRLR